MKLKRRQMKWAYVFRCLNVSVLLGSLMLVACSNPNNASQASSELSNPKASVQVQRDAAIAAIGDVGVVVQHVGETMTLVIDNKRIFHSGSANLHSDAKDILETIVRLIFIEQPEVVQVATFASTQNPDPAAQALSANRSKQIIDHLWHNGVNTRMLFARGDQRYSAGRHRLIFGPSAYTGRTLITFRLNRDHWL